MTLVTQMRTQYSTTPTHDMTATEFETAFTTRLSEMETDLAESNIQASQINTVAGEVNANAAEAAQSVVDAGIQAALALTAKTAAENASNATEYDTGKIGGYSVGEVVFSIAGKSYRCIQAQTEGNVQPLGDTAYWFELGSVPIFRSDRTSNTILSAIDHGTLINFTDGTFTQEFSPASTLGNGWFCYIMNSGPGTITLDPYGAETINDVASIPLYPLDTALIQCDASKLTAITKKSQGTLTVLTTDTIAIPANVNSVLIQAIGAGGGGASGSRSGSAAESGGNGGGGGGGVAVGLFTAGILANSTLTVMIGAGGAGGVHPGVNDNHGQAGVAGGTTTVTCGGVTLVSAIGGGAGGVGGSGIFGTGGSGGSTVVSSLGTSMFSQTGGNGGNGGYGGGAPGGPGADKTTGVPTGGGGGGGGVWWSGPTPGGRGGNATYGGITSTGGAGGAAGPNPGDAGESAASTPTMIIIRNFTTTLGPCGAGGGGAGSYDVGSGATGIGGTGGFPGGGGGSGTPVKNGYSAGSGGAGGNGMVRLFWF